MLDMPIEDGGLLICLACMSVEAILKTSLDGATHLQCGNACVQDQERLEKMPNRYMERGEYLDKMRKISEQQRIHPTRTFYPGQTYQPAVYYYYYYTFNVQGRQLRPIRRKLCQHL